MSDERRYETTRTHGNRHGFRGVEWDRSRQLYRARIEATPTKRGRWLGRFATAEAAAKAYDDAAREVYGTAARLNFPRPDEIKTHKSRLSEGLCPEGHDLATEGYMDATDRPRCRECDRMVSARAYRKRRYGSVPDGFTGASRRTYRKDAPASSK